MSRFFVEKGNVYDNFIVIDDKEDVNHISKVLRCKIGEEIMVSDQIENIYRCIITKIDKREVECSIEDIAKFEEEKVEIDLYQGIPKGSKLEFVIQKNIEAGINKIIPVLMDRSIKNDKESLLKKKDRFFKIAKSASEQSFRNKIVEVKEPIDFDEFIDKMSQYDLVVFPYENEDDKSLKNFLENIKIDGVRRICIIIGSEGGFSQKEVDTLKAKGIEPVTLGKYILRTETAGLVAFSMLNYFFNL